MATISRETRRREAPLGARTQRVNGVSRVSPTWRQRSRSYSHDLVLYRMGLRKNSAGQWTDVDDRVPAGLANAMRAMSVQSEVRVKREPIAESDIYGISERGGSVDMKDSTEVLEEISVYIDVNEWVASHINDGEEEEMVMQSVEIKTDFKVDVDMDAVMSGVDTGDMEVFQQGIRDSLGSIAEEDENRMDVALLVHEEQPDDARESNNTAGRATPLIRKRRKKWSDPEIHYVGALLDAGYKAAAIPDLFLDRFPDAPEITVGSVEYCRSEHLCQVKHLRESRRLSQQLGLVSGKWERADRILKEEDRILTEDAEREAEREKAKAIDLEQRLERGAMIHQHGVQLADGQAKLASDNDDLWSRTEAHSKLQKMFVGQREQWRNLLLKQDRQRGDHIMYSDDIDSEAQVYLRQLTILVQQSRGNLKDDKSAWKSYGRPKQEQWSLHQMLRHKSFALSWYSYSCGRGAQLMHEYRMAKLLLWQNNGPLSEGEYHKEAMDLLQFDENSSSFINRELELWVERVTDERQYDQGWLQAEQRVKLSQDLVLFRPEQMRSHREEEWCSQDSKKRWEYGLIQLYKMMENNPPDSQVYRDAYKKIHNFSLTLSDKLRKWNKKASGRS